VNRQGVVAAAGGLAAVAVMVGFMLWWTRGAHMVLEGSIQKVRVQAMDDNSAVVIVDFRFVNPSDHRFVVRSVDVLLQDGEGKERTGMAVSDPDAARLFEYFKLLGPKYNDSFRIRDQVASRQSLDRMVAARFEMSQAKLEARRGLRIRVEEVDGAVSELVEAARR